MSTEQTKFRYISAINHIVLGKFTIVNSAFILPPLLPQQTRSVFTIVKWEKPVTLENVFTVVNSTLLSSKKPKCDHSQCHFRHTASDAEIA